VDLSSFSTKKFLMIRWLIVLIGITISIIGVFSQKSCFKQDYEIKMELKDLFLIFIFTIFGVLFVLNLLRNNSKRVKNWKKPSWDANPFNLKNPLDFFHLCGYFIFFNAVAEILGNILKFHSISVEILGMFVMGMSVLSALKIAEKIYGVGP
jgi:hypothetical protein